MRNKCSRFVVFLDVVYYSCSSCCNQLQGRRRRRSKQASKRQFLRRFGELRPFFQLNYKTHILFRAFNRPFVLKNCVHIEMDSLNTDKVEKIFWKRSKAPLQLDDEIVNPDKCKCGGEKTSPCDSPLLSTYPGSAQPFVLPLLPTLTVEEWCSNTSIFLSGTACRGRIGPPVGVVDIGVSKSAYYFCVAAPGVKQDPGEFSCEIHRDGKVCVRGVTSTGEKTVKKYSREFVMKFQQQCPPGPFALTFNLPGPVDPRLVCPTFRSDGIFEVVVAKCE